jgi:hypothetical protein
MKDNFVVPFRLHTRHPQEILNPPHSDDTPQTTPEWRRKRDIDNEQIQLQNSSLYSYILQVEDEVIEWNSSIGDAGDIPGRDGDF